MGGKPACMMRGWHHHGGRQRRGRTVTAIKLNGLPR
jgi:hypothetical protein